MRLVFSTAVGTKKEKKNIGTEAGCYPGCEAGRQPRLLLRGSSTEVIQIHMYT